MWVLNVCSPAGLTQDYVLKPGRSVIGRHDDADLIIPDEAVSRLHAEITYDAETDVITLRDLGSLNRTQVNGLTMSAPCRLQVFDTILIGKHVLRVVKRNLTPEDSPPPSGTRPLTRDLLLEALDQHSSLLYEAATRLNTILDLHAALEEVAGLIRDSLEADKCRVILAEQFNQLPSLGFPTTIARIATERYSTVLVPNMAALQAVMPSKSSLLLRIRSLLCVPVVSSGEIVALIYVYKTNPQSRPLDEQDLKLVVAISHQTALTIQRARLLVPVQKEQRLLQHLRRFVPEMEAETLLREHRSTGSLPALQAQTLTVLVASLRGSSQLAERLGAPGFSRFLASYHEEMAAAIFTHAGLLSHFRSDGLLAVFGAARSSFNPEAQAVAAALEILDRAKTLSPAGAAPLEIGVGINTGPALAGYVGSDERLEFSVFGNTVKVAERLEAAAGNQIVIGPATRLAISDQFEFRSLGPVGTPVSASRQGPGRGSSGEETSPLVEVSEVLRPLPVPAELPAKTVPLPGRIA